MKNILKKNKKGAMSIFLTIVLVAVIVSGVGFGVYKLATMETAQAVTTGGVDQSECADASGILTANVVSALAQGTSVGTPTITCGVNDGALLTTVTSGTTTFPIGAKVNCLASKDDYIDDEFEFVMECGGKTQPMPIYYSTSDNPGIRAKNDDGDYMADSAGTNTHSGTNQTDVSAGETITWDLEFSGTSLESSGDGLFVVEFPAGSGANITKVELSGATLSTLPSVHTTINAGSKVVVFNVPAVVGSEKTVHTLTIELGAAKDLMGNTLMDWYAKQKFIDDDGSVSFGVEDSDGTLHYENSGDFDVMINSA